MHRSLAAFALLALVASPALADNLDYSVSDCSPATLKSEGDGVIFVDYANPVPGATYTLTLNVWAEAGGKDLSLWPTDPCPISVKKLSGFDASGWFSASPSPVSFAARGTDPVPQNPADAGYTGIPGGSYQPVTISFTVPSDGLPDQKVQVKIVALTAGVKFLGEGHGIIVRLSQTTEDDPFTITSWLSDSRHVPMSEYGDQFQVVTKGGRLDVAATNPGSFYYNVLVTTSVAIDALTVHIDPIPADFGLWGANSTHAWVGEVDVTSPDFDASIALRRALDFTVTDLPANSTVFVTVHVQFVLPRLPSLAYLPRDYEFSADGTALILDEPELAIAPTSAVMTGVHKR
jgi:hypothetical protein